MSGIDNFDKRILLMDEDIDFAESLGDVLAIKGFSCQIASNMIAAKEALEFFVPSIILVDMRFSQNETLDLLKFLNKKYPDIVIIVMSAYSEVENAVKALQCGAYAYLKKPIHIEELFSVFDRCYEKMALKSGKEKVEKSLEEKNIELESANQKLLKEKEHAELRAKEVHCLFSISHMLDNPDIELNEILRRTVDIVPSAFRYPESMCVRITVKDIIVCNNRCHGSEICNIDDVIDTKWIVKHDIFLQEEKIGEVLVWFKNVRDDMDIVLPFLREEYGLVNAVAELLGSIIERKKSEDALLASVETLKKTMEGIIEAMAMTTEMRDPYTAGHQRRVALLAVAIAEEFGLSEEEIDGIKMAAIIHDLGKIYVPAELLTKPGKITELEFSIIKTHAQVGHDILKNIEFPWPLAQIIYQHHERIDGTGYPRGIKSDNILLASKIISVADTVEAMASHRPYRPALGIDCALDEIKKYAGIHYDKKIVDICIKLFKEKDFSFE